MKSDEVGTTLKHPETINGNVKSLSKRIKRKDKGDVEFNIAITINCHPKSPDTGTRDTEDTEIRVSDTGTTTPGNRTRRTRYIYIYIYIKIYFNIYIIYISKLKL